MTYKVCTQHFITIFDATVIFMCQVLPIDILSSKLLNYTINLNVITCLHYLWNGDFISLHILVYWLSLRFHLGIYSSV